LAGSGFVLDASEAATTGEAHEVVKPYFTGRDLNQRHERRSVIDLFEVPFHIARERYPHLLQRIADRVKPDREAKASRNKDAARYAEDWWLFAKPRPEMRAALRDLTRYVATCRTSQHRVFTFITGEALPESTVIAVAVSDGFHLGVLSSYPHIVFSLRAGTRLGIGNDPRYNNTLCFGPFPFPDPSEAIRQRIGTLGEQLDAHRKRQQELHPDLTITGMYNVLEKLRTGEALTEKEKKIHEQGLLSVLKQIHDDLDAAVFDAYGWPHGLTDEQILERLVALNAERAEEESGGIIRWLRPEFQNPSGTTAAIARQSSLPSPPPAGEGKGARAAEKKPWPKELPQQVAAVRDLITTAGPLTTTAATKSFTGAKKKDVERVLDSLAALGLCISVRSSDGDVWR
jgi:hypothetical protein